MNYKTLTKNDLPKEFQDRIERFNGLFIKANDGTFEQSDLFPYEMGCIKQALAFYNYFSNMSLEEFKEFCGDTSAFDLIDTIKDKLLYFNEGHSGNSLSASWLLFVCYKQNPKLVPYMHGCLAGLVGDEGYHDDRSDIPSFDK